MQAILALEDGRIFRGRGYGASGERFGEVVFNTSLSGYQEILTDPSYAGQIVCLTYPHIGNYGTNPLDSEASSPFAEGLVVRELAELASNWRSVESMSEFLADFGMPVISDIDTRALVRHLRTHGSMRAVLSTVDFDEQSLLRKVKASPSMVGLDLASRVTTSALYEWSEPSTDIYEAEVPAEGALHHHVVAYDFGIKHNILRRLVDADCKVTVVPAATSAADVLALKPDGVFLSNGPGDPEPVDYAVRTIRDLMGKTPIFGICLGHQILGLAYGGKTYKLKFGHRGANQPVKDLMTGRIEITSQNHGFCVDMKSLNPDEVELTHINLNDNSCEGMRHKKFPAFSVQYHPENAPGPHDSEYLFDRFIGMLK